MHAGYVSGVQCDVYRSGSPTSNATTSFNAQTMLPAYKVRLPLCNGAAATCNGTWDFTLEVRQNTLQPFGVRLEELR